MAEAEQGKDRPELLREDHQAKAYKDEGGVYQLSGQGEGGHNGRSREDKQGHRVRLRRRPQVRVFVRQGRPGRRTQGRGGHEAAQGERRAVASRGGIGGEVNQCEERTARGANGTRSERHEERTAREAKRDDIRILHVGSRHGSRCRHPSFPSFPLARSF